MWIVRELLRLVEKIAIAFAVAFVLALAQAGLRGHGHFVHGLQISCLIMGALLLFMAGVGRNTSFERRLDYGITESAWGRVPGVSSLKTNPEDPTLTPGAVFVGAAIVLLAIGFLL